MTSTINTQGSVTFSTPNGTETTQTFNVVTTRKVREKFAKAHGETGGLAKVVAMVFGTGGVTADNQPIPPDASDNALKNQVYEKDLDSVTFPTATTCRFTVTLAGEECNGQEISEIALKDEDGDLVAIKTFGKKTKEADSTFVFEWDEEF